MCIFKMYVHVSLSVINSCKLRILAACLPPILALSDCQHCLLVIVYMLCVYFVYCVYIVYIVYTLRKWKHVNIYIIFLRVICILAAGLPPILALSGCQHCLLVIVYILCILCI